MNLPMVLEATLSRDVYDIDDLVDVIKNSGIKGIKEYKNNRINQSVEYDDGI